jgi:hypothetical protein
MAEESINSSEEKFRSKDTTAVSENEDISVDVLHRMTVEDLNDTPLSFEKPERNVDEIESKGKQLSFNQSHSHVFLYIQQKNRGRF